MDNWQAISSPLFLFSAFKTFIRQLLLSYLHFIARNPSFVLNVHIYSILLDFSTTLNLYPNFPVLIVCVCWF